MSEYAAHLGRITLEKNGVGHYQKMRARQNKPGVCKQCGKETVFTSPAQKWCVDCAPIRRAEMLKK